MTSDYDFDSSCRFPAIVLYYDGDLSIFEAMEGLVICRKIDLKVGQRGRFARASIVDSEAQAWEMDGAAKLHGVGPFWGYNILLSQTIRVRPNIMRLPTAADQDSVKSRVVKALRKRDAVTLVLKRFCTTIEHDEALRTLPLIEAATSVCEIIGKLLAMDFPEKKTLHEHSSRAGPNA